MASPCDSYTPSPKSEIQANFVAEIVDKMWRKCLPIVARKVDARKLIPKNLNKLHELQNKCFLRCVIAQAFCSQKSFREITLNYVNAYAKLR